MEITVLIDNEKKEQAYRSEHGLSMLIEFNGTTILFDTGKSDAFIQNAKLLGKDLSKVNYVVLSHGHYDHTGGLEAFMNINKTAKIVIKKEAVFENKLSRSTGIDRNISFPLKDKLEKFENRILWADKALELVPDLFVLSDIQRDPNHVFTDSFLYVEEEEGFVPDTFKDELFIGAVKNDKLIVFTGCAHNGIENMIQTAVDYTAIKEIEFVIGGTHLNRASEQQVKDTISRLKGYSIKRAAFNHCSGQHNIPKINEELDADVTYAFGGKSYKI